MNIILNTLIYHNFICKIREKFKKIFLGHNVDLKRIMKAQNLLIIL